LKDRDKARQAMEENHLLLSSGVVYYNQGPFTDVDQIRSALSNVTTVE